MRSDRDGLGRVLITGGASGLGAAVADAVEREGGRPMVLDRRGTDRVEHRIVDLADLRATEALVADLAHDGLDAVVTCAGIDSWGPLAEVPAADWDRVVAVNLLGTAAVVRAALPALMRSRGHVVTVASTLGLRAQPEATAYCAAKFGVIGFSRARGSELAGRVRVTCLIPGGMRTPFVEDRPERYRPVPEAILMDPQDVAAVIVQALRSTGSAEARELVITPAGESSWP